MRNTVFTLFLIVGTLALLLSGCDIFDEPYDISVSPDLQVKITAGPTGMVPNGAWVTFKWTTVGGTGTITGYQFNLDGAAWSASSLEQSATLYDLTTAGSHTFNVRATDSGGNTAQISQTFTVDVNSVTPVIVVTAGPEEGWKIATGRPITFAWMGSDDSPYFGTVTSYAFRLNDGAWSAWSASTSVTLTDVPAGDHTFYVKGMDNSGAEGEATGRGFTVQDANILWIDNWNRGNVPDENLEWHWWDMLLAGYAWAEWDLTDNGGAAPDLTGVTTVIWSTSENNWGTDGESDFFDLIEGAGDKGAWLKDWMDAGGNFIGEGSGIIDYGWWDQAPRDPGIHGPAEGEFLADYLGLLPMSYDFWGWDYWSSHLTFVHGVTDLGYPEEMKIDVGKDPDQERHTYATPFLMDDCTVIFNGGLDVHGDPMVATDEPVGHIYAPAEPGFMSCYLGFPAWYMPGAGMRTTMVNILTEFGE